MKCVFLFSVILLFSSITVAQNISGKLQKAFREFEADSQLKHAISSLYVIDGKTGEVVFDKNSNIGLAGASTQKIITAATAFEILGKNYRYKTEFWIKKEFGINTMVVHPSGDPTLGSWRWESSKQKYLFSRIRKSFEDSGYNWFERLEIKAGKDTPVIPDGWIWQDIANYYGAAPGELIWRENQFDLYLKSGSKIGDTVTVVGTDPNLEPYLIYSMATSAAKGSGDNAYIYFPLAHIAYPAIVKGTIPVNEDRFVISGALPSPLTQFSNTLIDSLGNFSSRHGRKRLPFVDSEDSVLVEKKIYTEFSPPLDSIIYWFLNKSINLYGEAMLKTIALEKRGFLVTDTGVSLLRDFWKGKGLDKDELNLYDGSGLSPLNRVTTHAQVEVLKYARTRDWYPYYFNALPVYNDMKMKSGTISDVKGFCGYHDGKDGHQYIFSFLVNNYNGSSASLVKKMYKVLDNLK